MYAKRLMPCLLAAFVLVFAATPASRAFASDEEDMKQISELYSRLLASYSDACIVKDSIGDECIDVVFAKKNNMLSNSLKQLLDKDAKRAKKHGQGNLDFDFLINGQDNCKAPLRIVSLKKIDSAYVMTLNNGCKKEKHYNPNYDFSIINESGRWVIDDATYYGAKKQTLKGILR